MKPALVLLCIVLALLLAGWLRHRALKDFLNKENDE
jgi:hypothetical protein